MSKRPVYEIKFGAIKASIWANERKSTVHHNVTLVRLYKNGESWVQSTQFFRDDLLAASKALDEAHTWICSNPKVIEEISK